MLGLAWDVPVTDSEQLLKNRSLSTAEIPTWRTKKCPTSEQLFVRLNASAARHVQQTSLKTGFRWGHLLEGDSYRGRENSYNPPSRHRTGVDVGAWARRAWDALVRFCVRLCVR